MTNTIKHILFGRALAILTVAGLLFSFVPAPAYAIIYQPGQTLDPACLPTDTNCGVAAPVTTTGTTSNVALSPTASISGSTAEIRLLELAASGTQYTGFKAPDALAANVLYVLPINVGSSGYVLTTNGAGILTWEVDDTGGGSAVGLRETGGSFVNKSSISFEAGSFALNTSGNDAVLRLDWGSAGPASRSQSNTWTGLNVFSSGASVSTSFEVSGTASISGATILKGVTYTWPSAQGSANQVLTNNGSGGLSWVTDSGVTSLAVPTGSNANGGSIASNVLTLSLADGTNPGLVSTGAQTFAGVKTFTSAPTFSTMTAGSVLFAGASGALTQDNANLFWDNTNNRLGIGTTAPASFFHSWSNGDNDLIIEADADDIGEEDNARLVLRQDGNLIQGIFGTMGNAAQYTGATVNSIFIESREDTQGNGIQFVTGGNMTGTGAAARMTIINTGNIGIGTSTPTSALHLVGNTATLFNVASGSNSRFVVMESGNVGVGTTNVDANFEVSGAASISGATTLRGVTYTWPSADGSSNQVLSTNSSGGLSWATAGGGGITRLAGVTDSTINLLTGTSGTDFNIATSSQTITFNIPDASSANRGLVTTGVQTFAGAKTFSGSGGLRVSSAGVLTNSITTTGVNLVVPGTSTSTTTAGVQLVGATTTTMRGVINPAAVTIGANESYSSYIFGNTDAVAEAISGAHPLIAHLSLKPLSITNQAGSTTNAATLYIEGAATGSASPTNNYALWVDNGTARFGGNVSIGTTTPSEKITIDLGVGNTGGIEITNNNGVGSSYLALTDSGAFRWFTAVDGSDAKFKIRSSGTNWASGSDRLAIDTSGNVGIGTTVPETKFEVVGTASSSASVVSGLVSCGGVQTNANGLMSCTSDTNLKDIHGEFNKGLGVIIAIQPQEFSWKEDTALYDGGRLYYGFIAQNIQSALPEAVNVGADGNLQVSHLTITAALVNAVKEQFGGLQGLKFTDTINYALVFSSTSSLDELAQANANDNLIFDPVGYIREKVDAGIKVVRMLVAEKIVVVNGYFKRIFANELCLTDSSGNLVCVTGENLKQISGQTQNVPPELPILSSTESEEQNRGSADSDRASSTESGLISEQSSASFGEIGTTPETTPEPTPELTPEPTPIPSPTPVVEIGEPSDEGAESVDFPEGEQAPYGAGTTGQAPDGALEQPEETADAIEGGEKTQ